MINIHFETSLRIIDKTTNWDLHLDSGYWEKNLIGFGSFPKKLNIYESLNTGSLKIYPSTDSHKSSNNFILKISGVWENEREYGLTFKILSVS